MSDKILKLDQAQTLYQDLRGRIDALPTSGDIPEVPVQDVQVAGSSVIGSDGVANIPFASTSTLGVIKANNSYGSAVNAYGELYISCSIPTDIKNSSSAFKPISPKYQHNAVFYGLAKAAGEDMSTSLNEVGTYTDAAKTAIKEMLGVQDGLKVVRLI